MGPTTEWTEGETPWPTWWTEHHAAAWEAAREGIRSREGQDLEGEIALKYGYSAAAYYGDQRAWNPALTEMLTREWSQLPTRHRAWEAVEAEVRRGWDIARHAEALRNREKKARSVMPEASSEKAPEHAPKRAPKRSTSGGATAV